MTILYLVYRALKRVLEPEPQNKSAIILSPGGQYRRVPIYGEHSKIWIVYCKSCGYSHQPPIHGQ